MGTSWESATTAQYDDDTNLAARQALLAFAVEASPLPAPLSDMSVLAGQTVLDVGCGNGLFLSRVVAHASTAIGADVSFGMAETARASANSPVLQANAESIPIADETIDTVLSLWMMYHVEHKAAAVAEYRRILRPGGQLVVTTNSGAHAQLDELFKCSLADVLGRDVEEWHAPLTFTSENGAEILEQSFPDVTSFPFRNTYDVTDSEVLVRYAGSLVEPIQAEHGELDPTALLTAVGRRSDDLINEHGSVTVERAGTVFIATK